MTPEIHINSLYNSVSYRIREALIDPVDRWVGFNGVEQVLLTHAHFDHIYGLNELLRISPSARINTCEAGRDMLLDARKNMSKYHETPFVFEHPESIVIVNDGDVIDLGGEITAKAVFTPGHNPSCITWIIGNALFSGDSYIPGIKTVTNLPGGNRCQATKSEELIRQLAIGRTIYPGHNV